MHDICPFPNCHPPVIVNCYPNSEPSPRHRSPREHAASARSQYGQMQPYPATDSNGLTEKQEQALPHIAFAASMRQGANRAQVDRSTLKRWMNDPHFRAELKRMRDEASSLAKAKLQGLLLKSVLVLDEALEDPDPALRQRAARVLINAALRAEETDDLRRRLDDLDDAYMMVKRQR